MMHEPEKMVWGGRRRCDTFGAVQETDGAPYAAIERSQPILHRPEPG